MESVAPSVTTIDSNIIISYLNGDERIARQLLQWKKRNYRFIISVITEIEVLSLPSLTNEEIEKIRKFIEGFTVIPLDSQLGEIAAEIRRNRKINLGDSVIIATAKLTNSALVTLDRDIIKKASGLIRFFNIA